MRHTVSAWETVIASPQTENAHMAGMNLINVPAGNPAYDLFVRTHMEAALGLDVLRTRMSEMDHETLVRLRRVREAAHHAWLSEMAVYPKHLSLNDLDHLLGYVPITDDMAVEFIFDGPAGHLAGDLTPKRLGMNRPSDQTVMIN